MKSITGKEPAKVLEHNGWKLLRVKGSHHIYGKTGSTVRISIPMHRNKALKIGLLKHLLKMADLDETDLE
jgi:predicted RNA binding protein YcfA (HicA-like mRNA interferase family)